MIARAALRRHPFVVGIRKDEPERLRALLVARCGLGPGAPAPTT